MSPWSRRDFLLSSVALSGGLLWGCPDPSPNPKEPSPEPLVDAGPDTARLDQGRDAGIDAGQVDVGSGDKALSEQSGSELPEEMAMESPPEQLVDAGNGCPNPFAGGELLGIIPFINEGGRPLNTLYGSGWDGRLYYDLSELSEKLLHTPNDRFFVRTRYPDKLDPNQPWKIRVTGHVKTPKELTMSDLTPRVRPMGSVLLECSGNGKGGHYGLLSAATWDGVPVEDILSTLEPTAKATRVLISGFDQHSTPSANGHSKPGCSWVFTRRELQEYGAFFATKMNGVPLPKDHGFPVRLVIPRWYGCTNVKWVDEIRFVDESEPSTSQMKEFASRTHQTRQHALAKDFAPATMDQAAMPVRIEQWRVGGKITYRIIGVMWGGYKVTTDLAISFSSGGASTPVSVCPSPSTNDTWSLWEHQWTPTKPGNYAIRMKVTDPAVRTRRLDSSFYLRQVRIEKV